MLVFGQAAPQSAIGRADGIQRQELHEEFDPVVEQQADVVAAAVPCLGVPIDGPFDRRAGLFVRQIGRASRTLCRDV